MSANILSPDERRELTTIPLDISDAELVRHFSLTPTDLSLIDHRLRPIHQLDQAAHLCLLRWLGWSPVTVNQLPHAAHAALCHQLHLDLPPETLEPPADRTSRLHAERARKHLGWRKYAQGMDRDLCQWLKPLAEEHDHGRALFDALQRRLYQEKIVRSGLAHLERMVETTRNLVKARLNQAINSQLTSAQKKQLDELLVVPPGETRSPLHRLKDTPARASGPELREVLNHIETLRALGLGQLDLGPKRIHPNRLKLLARRARQRTNWDAARLVPDERYPLLVCLLAQLLHEQIDLAVAIHGEIIKNIFQRAKTRRDKEIVERGKSLNEKALLLGRLARLILDEAGIPDAEVRPAIYRTIPRDRLAHTVRECDEITQPADFQAFSFAARSYAALRQFATRFLQVLQFQAETKDDPLLEAITFIRDVDSGKHPFEKPPLRFVPWRWKPYVVDNAKKSVDRRMYELCLHDCLAEAVAHGEVWVPGSQTYTRLRDDWISDANWPEARKKFIARFPHLADVDEFLRRAQVALDAQMAEANRVWPDLQDEVWIENDEVHLARLEARDLPAGTARLEERLTNRLPRVGIAQLLLEVNHWVGIDRLLVNLNPQEHPVENLTAKKMAVLLGEGLNIGLQNLSYSLDGMTYADLAGVYDRFFREDTLRQAIVAVVNFYHHLPITRHWGDGTASSSDGQIFGVPVKTVYAQYHPESPSRSGRALSLYTHVSDHGMPFYQQVIYHLSQEGAYVLDGLLYHETDLALLHHYVDTGGYQDILWGGCHVLDFSLEPRIRDIGDMRLFRMRRKVDEYPHIASLFTEPINQRAIRENWESVLRAMASIYSGVAPASRLLRKLSAYQPEGGLAKALQQVGRIAKTLYLLPYFTRREQRQRVQRGLNRSEGFHALVGALVVGPRELRLREVADQLNRASCLQLLTAMVITWNAAYLSAAVEQLRSEGVTITPEQLTHILPLISAHINRLGRYEIDPTAAAVQTSIQGLRLRSNDEIAEQLGLGI